MGLFRKSKMVDACIAFIGLYQDCIDIEDMDDIGDLYARQLRANVKASMGPIPFRVFIFYHWSSQIYELDTLLDVRKNGFSPMDEGEKKKLRDKIELALNRELGASLKGCRPDCIIGTDDQEGIFTILCRVMVKESKL